MWSLISVLGAAAGQGAKSHSCVKKRTGNGCKLLNFDTAPQPTSREWLGQDFGAFSTNQAKYYSLESEKQFSLSRPFLNVGNMWDAIFLSAFQWRTSVHYTPLNGYSEWPEQCQPVLCAAAPSAELCFQGSHCRSEEIPGVIQSSWREKPWTMTDIFIPWLLTSHVHSLQTPWQ